MRERHRSHDMIAIAVLRISPVRSDSILSLISQEGDLGIY